MIEGVDYAWDRPRIADLAAAGKRFACRYGGPGSAGKQLDAAEAKSLAAAGLWIVANAEGTADGLLGGWSTGADWARQADQHFRACGMPKDRPIYLSVDWDVTSAQWPRVADGLRGAASVIGAGRVGVYGGYRAVTWARRDGVATWYWQTYAWSGGKWAPGNHAEQYRNGVTLGGADLDLDRALAADYGQWMPGTIPTLEDDMGLDNATPLYKGGPTERVALGDLHYAEFKGNLVSVVQQALAAAKLREEAILDAVKGVDTAAILARIDQVAQADAERDADLRALVQQAASGELDAAEVVRLIGERLTTAATPQG